LVANNIISAAIPAFVFWFYIKWRPIWSFSWQSFRELFSFGFFMFLTHLINSFCTQIQGLLIGKIYNPSVLGYYSKAHGTEKLASLSISSVMTQVTYPLYAEAQDDKKVLANMIKRITMTLAYLSFPLMFILLLVAKPLFLLLYSERWLPSVPYFQILCIAGLSACLQSVNLQAISAIGKSKVMFEWTVLKRVVGISAILGGLLLYGIKGLLFGVVFNYWFSYFVNISLVSRHIEYKFWSQICDLLPVALASTLIAFISYAIGYLLGLDIYFDGLVKLIAYITLYIGWSLLLKPEAFTYFLSVLPNKLKRRKK
jgi:O-antigen/teichoic acid export membrane protein